jgi:hypothetical protein
MEQTDFLGFPIPVTLALIALVLGLLAVARVLASFGKQVPLRLAHNEHDGHDRAHSSLQE